MGQSDRTVHTLISRRIACLRAAKKSKRGAGLDSNLTTEELDALPIPRPWEESDVAFLRESAGKQTVREIARAIQRSPRSIRCKASELHIPLAFGLRVRCSVETLTALCEAGMGSKEIAARYGVSRFAVWRYRHEIGFPSPGPGKYVREKHEHQD